MCTVETLDARKGTWKDLWGWVSVDASANACLLAITVSELVFPLGHEAFFIVAPTTQQQRDTKELLQEHYPDLAKKWEASGRRGNVGAFDTSKAERMLGWKEIFSNAMS